MDQLTQLRKMTMVVADTGDFEQMKQYTPLEATTNPSLIYQASQDPKFQPLIEEAIQRSLEVTENREEVLDLACDLLFVLFAKQILDVIPGRVSIEVDASLSFDTEASIKKAHTFISLLTEMGIDTNRILIKLASTWEGIQAAKFLENEGIHCNMTLIFNLYQAIACGDVKATLISPFVGRIVDWHSKQNNNKTYLPHEDPGVIATKEIYDYYKKFSIPTQVMAASLRSKEQVAELAGCDLMTIPLNVLESLSKASLPMQKKLNPIASKDLPLERISLSESSFRFQMNQDPLATEKLSDGIRKFVADMNKLKLSLKEKIAETSLCYPN